jgi:excisionase family DNA binding protein
MRLNRQEVDVSDEAEVVFTIAEVARKLKLSRNGAYNAARRGDIPTIKIGNALRVTKTALARLLDPAPA